MQEGIIVGLDLATFETGYVEYSSGLIVENITIKQDKKTPTYIRIYNITNEVVKLIKKRRGKKTVLIEDVYNIRNNTLCLVELRAMIIFHLIKLDIPFKKIPANTARYTTSALGYKTPKKLGRTERKTIIKNFVEKKFNHIFKSLDESDAALLILSFLETGDTTCKKKKTKSKR